jgi:hypothetical protein
MQTQGLATAQNFLKHILNNSGPFFLGRARLYGHLTDQIAKISGCI